MTQENKALLLKDLCARLPYGVKVESVFINPDTKEHKSCGIEVFNATSLLMIRDGLGEFKPYLFPLSSMTEEQKYEYDELIHSNNIKSIEGFITTTDCSTAEIDWLLKNNFDFRGLIPMGLAIDATGLKIY